MPEIICVCDECEKEAVQCLCQEDYDKRLEDEYERGKADGKQEAAEELQSEDSEAIAELSKE